MVSEIMKTALSDEVFSVKPLSSLLCDFAKSGSILSFIILILEKPLDQMGYQLNISEMLQMNSYQP
jgi:hypothetical protein